MKGAVPDAGAAKSFNVSPAQRGVFALTLMVVAGLTTTFVVPTLEQPLLSVMLTVYVPDMPALAPVRVGFCEALVNEVAAQLYVKGAVPPVEDDVRFSVPPAHTGELLDALTVKPGLTVIFPVDAVAVQPLLSVTTTVYTPLMAVVIAPLVVSLVLLVKEAGPDQT